MRAYRSVELVPSGGFGEMTDLFGIPTGPRPEGAGLSPEEQWAQLTGGSPESEAYGMLVDDLELPTYVHSVLTRAGIERVGDLLKHNIKELLAVPGLGQKSLEEVRGVLAERGWVLRGDGGEMYEETEGAVVAGDAAEGDPASEDIG